MFHCMSRPHLVYLFIVCQAPNFYHTLPTVKNTALKMGVQRCFWSPTSSSSSMCLEAELLDHMAFLFLTFLRDCHSVHHSNITILYSYQSCKRTPGSPDSYYFILVFTVVILLDGMLYFLGVLTGASLVVRGPEPFLWTCWPFLCLLWGNFCPRPLPTFDPVIFVIEYFM